MAYLNDLDCCGVRELSGIRDHRTPEKTLRDAFEGYEGELDDGKKCLNLNFCHIIFTDVVGYRPTYGDFLAQYIEANGLGVVTFSVVRKNPNTGNQLRVWVWSLPRTEGVITKWYYEKKKSRRSVR